MSGKSPQPIRGFHDLNNVTTLVIYGWDGEHRVVPAEGAWAEIETSPRHPEEYWTFGRPANGILPCHTSLLGSPSLLPTNGRVMTIKVPQARMDGLRIEFAPARRNG